MSRGGTDFDIRKTHKHIGSNMKQGGGGGDLTHKGTECQSVRGGTGGVRLSIAEANENREILLVDLPFLQLSCGIAASTANVCICA